MRREDSRIPPLVSSVSVVPSLAGGIDDQRAHIVDRDVHLLNHRVRDREKITSSQATWERADEATASPSPNSSNHKVCGSGGGEEERVLREAYCSRARKILQRGSNTSDHPRRQTMTSLSKPVNTSAVEVSIRTNPHSVHRNLSKKTTLKKQRDAYETLVVHTPGLPARSASEG